MILLQPFGSEASACSVYFDPGSNGLAAGEFQDFPEDALQSSACASSEYAPFGVISSKTSDPVDSIDHYIDAYEVLAAGEFQDSALHSLSYLQQDFLAYDELTLPEYIVMFGVCNNLV